MENFILGVEEAFLKKVLESSEIGKPPLIPIIHGKYSDLDLPIFVGRSVSRATPASVLSAIAVLSAQNSIERKDSLLVMSKSLASGIELNFTGGETNRSVKLEAKAEINPLFKVFYLDPDRANAAHVDIKNLRSILVRNRHALNCTDTEFRVLIGKLSAENAIVSTSIEKELSGGDGNSRNNKSVSLSWINQGDKATDIVVPFVFPPIIGIGHPKKIEARIIVGVDDKSHDIKYGFEFFDYQKLVAEEIEKFEIEVIKTCVPLASDSEQQPHVDRIPLIIQSDY